MLPKSYINYKFLGITPFVSTLEKAKMDYHLFDDDFAILFSRYPGILEETDTIRTGIAYQKEQRFFFAEFGLKITKSYHSYILFIFDHHPGTEDLCSIIEELESIVMENVDKADLSAITDAFKQPSS